MQVISAVIQKAMSSEMLSHYTEVLNGIEGCFDTNFSYDRIAELVRQQLEDGGSWNIVSYSVDGTGDTRPVSYTHLDVYKRQVTVSRATISKSSFIP